MCFMEYIPLTPKLQTSLDIGVGSRVQLAAICSLKRKAWFNSDLLDTLPASSLLPFPDKLNESGHAYWLFNLLLPLSSQPAVTHRSTDTVLVKMVKSKEPFKGLTHLFSFQYLLILLCLKMCSSVIFCYYILPFL